MYWLFGDSFIDEFLEFFGSDGIGVVAASHVGELVRDGSTRHARSKVGKELE